MNGKLFRSVMAVVGALVLLFALLAWMAVETTKVEAGAVASWYWDTVEDGSTGYTSARNSAARRVANFSELQMHATSELSGTGVMTLTPQFSSQATTCAAITSWFTAEERLVFVSAATTDTLLNKVIALELVLTNDTNRGMELSVQGFCVRFVIDSDTSRFTPTLRLRMVNEY